MVQLSQIRPENKTAIKALIFQLINTLLLLFLSVINNFHATLSQIINILLVSGNRQLSPPAFPSDKNVAATDSNKNISFPTAHFRKVKVRSKMIMSLSVFHMHKNGKIRPGFKINSYPLMSNSETGHADPFRSSDLW